MGVEVFMRLAAKADVILENYRPDIKTKLGCRGPSKDSPASSNGSSILIAFAPQSANCRTQVGASSHTRQIEQNNCLLATPASTATRCLRLVIVDPHNL